MDYSVETSPDIGSDSGSGVGDGVYTVDISGLEYVTEYTWYVNVTDGTYWKHKVFGFRTEPMMVFDPFDEGWHYRKQITIDHTKVDGDLTNFTILISTVDSGLRDNAQDDGDDILFMDDSGVATRIFHENEYFDDNSGELVAWVNVPDLSSESDTILYMYYGSPSCNNQQFLEKVWIPDYEAVYHLNDKTSSSIKDSTGNNNDGVKKSTNNPLEENGKIGFAQEFSDDCLVD